VKTGLKKIRHILFLFVVFLLLSIVILFGYVLMNMIPDDFILSSDFITYGSWVLFSLLLAACYFVPIFKYWHWTKMNGIISKIDKVFCILLLCISPAILYFNYFLLVVMMFPFHLGATGR